MRETTWMYVTVCIAVPLLWGLVTEWVSGRVEGYVQKRRRPPPDRAQPPTTPHYRTPETLDYRI
ncbi:MAG: hypothetical protein EXS64_03205 [Candidatus Latescibacteria bacterium]|nr:hypothetical protein [Candidatus Latescibacterota bacterium]